MTRRELRIKKPLTVAELQATIKPGSARLQPIKNGFRLVGRKRVRVYMKPWKRIPGLKAHGSVVIIRADYPPAVWWWIAGGILPVFLAQWVYDQQVRKWTAELASDVRKAFPTEFAY